VKKYERWRVGAHTGDGGWKRGRYDAHVVAVVGRAGSRCAREEIKGAVLGALLSQRQSVWG